LEPAVAEQAVYPLQLAVLVAVEAAVVIQK
jgi:hypothetical protein